SLLQASLQINGLPDIQETFLDAEITRLTTNNTDLQRWVPVLSNSLPINLSALGTINFNGNFTGFLHDFVAYGNFSTAIGFVHSDLNMKLGKYHTPIYSGKLSAREFDLGKFLNTEALGPTTFQTQLNGQG